MQVLDDSYQVVILDSSDPAHQPILHALRQRILISTPGAIVHNAMRVLDAKKYKDFRKHVTDHKPRLTALGFTSSLGALNFGFNNIGLSTNAGTSGKRRRLARNSRWVFSATPQSIAPCTRFQLWLFIQPKGTRMAS